MSNQSSGDPPIKSKGRPYGSESDTRQALLEAAKHCFSEHPYEKVTTRKLATMAGVNVGLIKYYFINKEGLYKAMFHDFAQQIALEIKRLVSANQITSFEPIFRHHANLMMKYPQFPLLIQRELSGLGRCGDYLAEAITSMIHPHFDESVRQLQEKGIVSQGIELPMLRISLISLMIFPWLSRVGLERTEGIAMTEEMVEKLIVHNARLLEKGSFG